MKKKIYVIDDEKDIRDILHVNLENEGYDVFPFPSAENALKKIDKDMPDIIILDIMMEGMDGYEFCRQLKGSDKYKAIPIIYLSAKFEEFDKVLGLELGGDDYIAKPFGIKELISRVKAVLRRTAEKENKDEELKIIQYKGIEFSPEKFSLMVDGNEVKLTKTEFEILNLFLKNPGRIFTRNNILDRVRGDDVYVVDRTIDVHIMNLRKKLGKYKNVVTTFSGVGYGFKE